MNPQGSFCIDPQNNLDVSVCILLTQDFLKKTQSGLTARSNELGRRSCTLHPDILRICQVEFASTCLRRLFSFFFRSLWFLLKRLLCQNMLIPLHSHWHTVVFIDCFMKERAETLTFNLNCQLAMCFFFFFCNCKKSRLIHQWKALCCEVISAVCGLGCRFVFVFLHIYNHYKIIWNQSHKMPLCLIRMCPNTSRNIWERLQCSSEFFRELSWNTAGFTGCYSPRGVKSKKRKKKKKAFSLLRLWLKICGRAWKQLKIHLITLFFFSFPVHIVPLFHICFHHH